MALKLLGVGLDDIWLTVNGGGDFDVGGPWGDNGLSGKVLVVDAYGPPQYWWRSMVCGIIRLIGLVDYSLDTCIKSSANGDRS